MFYTTFFRKYRAPELVVAQVPYNWLMPLTGDGKRPLFLLSKDVRTTSPTFRNETSKLLHIKAPKGAFFACQTLIMYKSCLPVLYTFSKVVFPC